MTTRMREIGHAISGRSILEFGGRSIPTPDGRSILGFVISRPLLDMSKMIVYSKLLPLFHKEYHSTILHTNFKKTFKFLFILY